MRSYKIKRTGNKWIFELIPCNNNSQPIGQSSMFDSREECKKGLLEFRMLVIDTRIDDLNHENVVLSRDGRKYQFAVVNHGQTLYQSRWLEQKANCKKSIAMIYKCIDEYTLHEFVEK